MPFVLYYKNIIFYPAHLIYGIKKPPLNKGGFYSYRKKDYFPSIFCFNSAKASRSPRVVFSALLAAIFLVALRMLLRSSSLKSAV
jgi:hypothetical protein